MSRSSFFRTLLNTLPVVFTLTMSLFGSESYIGVMTTNGPVSIDGELTAGGGTVFSGAVIKTGEFPAQVTLRNGTKVYLAGQSGAQLFENAAQLESGSLSMSANAPFDVRAGCIHLSTPNSLSAGALELHGKQVNVSMFRGTAIVRNVKDILVAKMFPQQNLTFSPSNEGSGQEAAVPPVAMQLFIIIEQGDGALNNIQQREAREVVVRVEDENHKPVSQASLLFLLPKDGASGVFSNGSISLPATTDATGHASVSFKPNDVPGNLQIRVEAASKGAKSFITFSQVNTLGGAAAAAGAGAAAGAAAGASTGAISGTVVAGIAIGASAAAVAAVAAVAATNSPSTTLSPSAQ